MTSMWGRLFAHYRDYHAYGPPRLKYMGYLGVLSLVVFYFIRFTRPNAQLFDDLALRGTAVMLLSLLALKDYWPQKLKKHYIAYSYFAVLYCLPCFTVLVALQRGGGMPAISNAFITLCFLVLLTDWRNTLVMLVAGTAMAVGIYAGTTPNPRVPMDLVAQLPAFILIVIGGNLFKFSTEQIDAERKLRATQALAGSIAHEMRHPLSQLRHSLHNIQQALPAPGAAAQPQALGSREVEALYRHLAESEIAVNRGLQVIAMTLDEVSAKPLDTAGFAHLSAAEATRKAAQEYSYEDDEARRCVQVEVVEDFIFRGDETAYLFVLFNLIKNALYYRAQYPGARLTITVAQHEVRVRDSGPGIPPEVLAGLFEPFRSVGKTGGTGLGLSYCQRVMRAFGGHIACASTLGQFTEFTLAFPPVARAETEASHADALAQARALFQGRRILLVDDDAALRLTTRHKLHPLGATLDEAADGHRALQMLARERYDLVLLDLNMPVLDGYALAARIRQGAVPANRDVALVAHTSEPAHVAGVKVRKSGMEGFVSKPSDQLVLMRALCQALQRPASVAGAELLAGCTVLLADDSAWNRKAVAAHLRHAGADVVEASHGLEVLERLAARVHWDALIMDINMPGMNGLDTSRAIRGSGQAFASLPIIALTAHSDPLTVQAARDAGMSDFITKPVDVAMLYALLCRLTGRAARPAVADVVLPAGTVNDLLDARRLENYQRLGMIDELLGDYLPEMARLVDRLDEAVAQGDLEAGMDALHSLLGMSGEAGAAALHQRVRSYYVPMVEGRRWPDGDDWPTEIRALAVRTEVALRHYAQGASRMGAA
jgi:two-component system CAI-1 autoinducer sensor kinase/phosphatase CqsS